MEIQHINAKLLLEKGQPFDLEPLIPIFHAWIQDRVFDERLLDIADYRHVHDGPGIILIGLEGDYSVDNTDGRLGVRYNRKAPLEGSNEDRLKQAVRAALNACQRLEAEAGLAGKLRFNGEDIEVFINDRLLAPNTPESRAGVQPELEKFADELFRGATLSISYDSEPRQLLTASLKSSRPFSSADLLRNLST